MNQKGTNTMFTKLFAAFFKTATTVIMIAVIAPVAYFGYRLTQPMDLPQFKGLSYVQFAEWRTNFLTSQAMKYQQEHPHANGTPQYGYVISKSQCENGNMLFDTLRAVTSSPYVLLQDYLKNDWSRITDFPWNKEVISFFAALGELRATFGICLAQICVRYGIDVEEQLSSMLPPSPDSIPEQVEPLTYEERQKVIEAAGSNDVNLFRKYIHRLDKKSFDANLALLRSTLNNNIEIVKLLIEHGIDRE